LDTFLYRLCLHRLGDRQRRNRKSRQRTIGPNVENETK